MPPNPQLPHSWRDEYYKFFILVVLPLRFLGGKELNGRPKTDAGWRHAGTEARDKWGRPRSWSYKPYYKRAAIRWFFLTLIVWSVWGWFWDHQDTVITWRFLLLNAFIYACYIISVRSRRSNHFKTFIKPLHDAMADKFGISRHKDPRQWIQVPRGHQTDSDKVATLKLPPDFNQTEKQREDNAKLVAEILQMEDPAWSYDISGGAPSLYVHAAPEPPRIVSYEDIMEAYQKAAKEAFVLGLGKGDRPFTASLRTDSPHILLSMGSGGGKSEFCKGIALQALARNFQVIILDCVKAGESAMWAKYIEGIEIITTVVDQHHALIDLGKLALERQTENVRSDGRSGLTDKPILIIFEEANTATTWLQDYWKGEAPNAKDPSKIGNTTKPPAIQAIKHLLAAGRSAHIHMLTVAQRASAAVCGGGDARENYGIRIANKFTPQTAKMLFPDVDPLPASPGAPGRVQVIINGKASLVQTPMLGDPDDPFYTNPSALEWACPGSTTPEGPENRGGGTARTTGIDLRKQGGQGGGTDLGQLPPDPLITLEDALIDKVVTATSRDALRKKLARTNGPKPKVTESGKASLYDREELRKWGEAQ